MDARITKKVCFLSDEYPQPLEKPLDQPGSKTRAVLFASQDCDANAIQQIFWLLTLAARHEPQLGVTHEEVPRAAGVSKGNSPKLPVGEWRFL